MSKALQIIRMLSERLTRKDIENEYDVDEYGMIKDLGKFEGEMLYVPYFYDMYMDGFYDEQGDDWVFFEISDDDRKQFPELEKKDKGIVLWFSEQGFVSGEISDKPPEEEEEPYEEE